MRRRSRRSNVGPILLALVGLGLLVMGAAARDGQGSFTRGRHVERFYRLYVPGALAEAPPPPPQVPLVVALHGCWQTPEDFAQGTRLNEAAERRGFLALYPAQGPRDHPSRCWNWSEPAHRERGEVGEILALVQHVAGQYPVARDRIFVLGLSAGGFMAVNLACAAPDVVAGVAVAAGGPYRCGVGLEAGIQCMRGQHVDGEASAAACRATMGGRARPIPATLWHGADDVVVSPVNLDALAVMFSRLNAIVASTTAPRSGVVHAEYRDAGGRLAVETWLIEGMSHAWSGGDPRATHTFPPGPSATERILDFLLGG